jgi:hypothetical protein
MTESNEQRLVRINHAHFLGRSIDEDDINWLIEQAGIAAGARQEPVGWIDSLDGSLFVSRDDSDVYRTEFMTPVYAAPQPAYCCCKCGAPDLHARQIVEAQDAARGNFRSNDTADDGADDDGA